MVGLYFYKIFYGFFINFGVIEQMVIMNFKMGQKTLDNWQTPSLSPSGRQNKKTYWLESEVQIALSSKLT